MPIQGVNQPDCIIINEKVRLTKYHGICDFALKWYQDRETLDMVDGLGSTLYDMQKLNRMYSYLDNHGELYIIQMKSIDVFKPIGDVTFWQEDIPIVIGEKNCRGCGIGKLVIIALINRAREIGYKNIYVNEIYKYNIPSQSLFESAGFKKYNITNNGYSYELVL